MGLIQLEEIQFLSGEMIPDWLRSQSLSDRSLAVNVTAYINGTALMLKNDTSAVAINPI